MIRLSPPRLKMPRLPGSSILVWIFTTLKGWMMGSREKGTDSLIMYDRTLLWLTFGLAAIGLIMVTSASIPIGQCLTNDPLLFTECDGVYPTLAFILTIITLCLLMKFQQRYSVTMLLGPIILLMVVLVVGSPVKGTSCWIDFGLPRIQSAGLTKLSLFCYIANYLVRKDDEVRDNLRGPLKSMGIILVLAVLLLTQLGLDTVVVLFVVILTMLFLVEAKLWQFIVITGMGISVVVLLTLAEPYRTRRVAVFWNSWEDPFGSDYQLTRSLMAFGRDKLWGQGLGNSIQELKYLPEAHTDSIFVTIDGELGYVGVVLALLMAFFVAFRAMPIDCKALKIDHRFSGLLICSTGIQSNFQALVNVGAAAGMLPTKGLTLSLISHGGSSLLIMSIAITMLLHIDYETRPEKAQAFVRGSR